MYVKTKQSIFYNTVRKLAILYKTRHSDVFRNQLCKPATSFGIVSKPACSSLFLFLANEDPPEPFYAVILLDNLV